MPAPFEIANSDLEGQIENLTQYVFEHTVSRFLLMPKGENFTESDRFEHAYEVLHRRTSGFSELTDDAVWDAILEDSLCLVVLRTILGLSPPEWADLAREETGNDINQQHTRTIESNCKSNKTYVAELRTSRQRTTAQRIRDLITTAVAAIIQGPRDESETTIHRLRKFDTVKGIESLRAADQQGVPYRTVLYERFLGRPFATHRDAVSELVGDVMESAVQEILDDAKIPYVRVESRQTVPGFDQAPDFVIPDEAHPSVVIEAKITGDDGTARDKVARIQGLVQLCKNRHEGHPPIQVVACVDGRGFRVRQEDMRKLILACEGKVFTLSDLDKLVEHTDIKNFLPK